MKKVTLIITTYNANEYLLNQINLLKKLNDICKFIIIDDNSKDHSVENFKKNIQENEIDDLLVIKNKKNIGLVCSRKKAIKSVNTDFFIFLDVDDILNAEIFKTLANKLTNQILVPWRVMCDPDKKVLNVNKKKIDKKNYFLKSYYGFWGIFIPKKLFYDDLLIDNYDQGEDINIFTLLANNNFVMYETKMPLYYHLRRNGSMSDSKNWNIDKIQKNKQSIYKNQLNVLNNINDKFYDAILANFIRRNSELLSNEKFIYDFIQKRNKNKISKRQFLISTTKKFWYKFFLIVFSSSILSTYLYLVFNNEIKIIIVSKFINLFSFRRKRIVQFIKKESNFYD